MPPPDFRSPRVQSSGYQLLDAGARSFEQLLFSLGEPRPTECVELNAEIWAAMEHRFLSWIPLPRYDSAWAGVHRLRSALCRYLRPVQLFTSIIPSIEEDLPYAESDGPGPLHAQLRYLESAVQQVGNIHIEATRAGLEQLSNTAAMARESEWLKVNLKRLRLQISAGLLFTLILMAVLITPHAQSRSTSLFYLLVVVYGAIGGVVSSLQSPEAVTAQEADFYVSRLLMLLRPIVGAAIAIAAYFAVERGVLSLFGVSSTNTIYGYYFLAFASGFAERAVTSKLTTLS
jgi:hypothetical protein